MGLPERFCCCSLERGTTIVGVIHAVLVCIWFIGSLVALSNTHYGITVIMAIFYVLVFILYFGIAGCLIHGARNGRRFFMFPWIMVVGSSLIASCYYGIILVVVSPIWLLAYVIIVLFAYMWLCVFSLYEKKTAEEYRAKNTSVEYKGAA